jgi:ABC-2 type transport system permease protein
MFRNRWSIAVMILGPILIIAVLSSAFSELMKSYEGVDEFSVGYRVIGGNTEIIEAAKTAGKGNGISFNEYSEGDIRDVMVKNELAGFIEFSDNSYILYKTDDYKVEGVNLEYFINKVMNEGINASLPLEEEKEELKVEKIDYMPAIDSVDYYGIIYIVYFCWCGMICATGVLSNEKKYGIARRFQISNISEIQNYLGKFIPIILTVSGGMGIATGITVLLYDIHWGNPLMSMIIVLFMIMS